MSGQDLFALAALQRGYFTTAQAGAHGLSRRALPRRASNGQIEHVAYGLWRLTHWPIGPDDELYALQALAPFGTFSHETALLLHGLSDLIPSAIHLTIPESSRLSRRSGVRLHRSRTGAERERVLRDGLWVSTPVRALLDSARIGSDPDQLIEAARQAQSRGLLSAADLARLSAHSLFRHAAA